MQNPDSKPVAEEDKRSFRQNSIYLLPNSFTIAALFFA